jgi:glycosyltransferase involved in cell wall biosynthesis
MPEVIDESGAGFIYDTNDELVSAMDRLLADPSYRNLLGQRGYKAYKKNWTADVHLKRYFEVIDGIIADRNPSIEYPIKDGQVNRA